ncbi:PQ-loop domain containing protein [Trichuris trichiura]|uniref:PQ-loop domain containing protein n=1 Tax=Trichuris trichiura TaxID=36087 RepID=A0A077Z9V2_TRITR|nr:PQ-loop domain containing protein [Trichuris trichiura]
MEENFILISVYRLDILNLISSILGWVYFAAWTISFWPQIVLNIRRKSVVGLNFDFLALNSTGFLFYSVYNCALFYIPLVCTEQRNSGSSARRCLCCSRPSSYHSYLCNIPFTIHHCTQFKRGSQRISRICAILLAVLWGVALVALIVAALSITLQVVLNYRRKSTEGFSIASIFLDFTGGMCSMCQMFIIAYNMDEWSQLFGDFTKFGLGLQSIIFDVIFFVQRYGLYGQYNPMQESVTSSTLSY